MSTRLDTMSPLYMGEDMISVALSPATTPAVSDRPVTVDFDTTRAADAGGLVLPMVLTITSPSSDGSGYIRKVFRRTLPSSFAFVPREAGTHLVLLKEHGHNRWQGRLLVAVEGEQFSKILLNERV